MNDVYTTEEIRDLFAAGVLEQGGVMQEGPEAEFNRWLHAHDTEIRTAALEEAAGIADARVAEWFYVTGMASVARRIANMIRAAKVGD